MVPTEYEFEKWARLRGLNRDNHFTRLEAGFMGEEKFYQYLKEFGSKHWTILRNRWFKDGSPFECDFILIAGHALYVFEVKNYFGTFVYEKGQSYSRGVPITYNPINQARNARLHLQSLLRQYPVKGALVFIGEHNQVCIKDDILDIRVLETNEVYEFIQTIKQEEKQYTRRYLNAKEIVSQLERFEMDPPYLPAPYTREDMARVKTGVFCANCQEKVLVKRDKYVTCSCGLRESKEEAIVRTACEYGVLTYGRDFTVNDIYTFLGGYPSRDYLRAVLGKYFKINPSAKVLTFCNPNREFAKLTHQFAFELPRFMVLK